MFCDYDKLCYEKLLDGENALITGGAAGIGLATALLFAQHGAVVAIADKDAEAGKKAEEALKAINPDCFFVQADMGVREEVDVLCDTVIARMKTIGVLVNNAGVFEGGLLQDADLAALDRMYAVNVMGTVQCTQRILPAMIAQKGGNIVNIASDYAIRGVPGVSLFAATKGAVYSFTRAMAIELGRYDIRVNCILPGMNITSHGDRFIEKQGEEFAEEAFTYMQLIKRRGTAEDVANAALFLGSQLSRFLTGDAIEVNGGIDARAHKQGMHANEKWIAF